MKDQIIREIIYKIKSRPDLKKKLKVAVLVGAAGLFLTAGLLVWAAFSAFNYVGNQLQAANVKGTVESLQTNIKNISVGSVNTLGCWQQAQSMLTVDTWLNRPLAQNLSMLRSSCLSEPMDECKTEDCKKPEQNQEKWG